jgi:hypothetical protein
MTSSPPNKVPSRYFEKICCRSSILKREIGSTCLRESGRSSNLVNPSTNMQFLPQLVLKLEIPKSILVLVAMSLSHPYQLKVVTDFVLHNFIQPKEKLIQGNGEKSLGLAPNYLQQSNLKHLQHTDHRYGSHVPYRV